MKKPKLIFIISLILLIIFGLSACSFDRGDEGTGDINVPPPDVGATGVAGGSTPIVATVTPVPGTNPLTEEPVPPPTDESQAVPPPTQEPISPTEDVPIDPETQPAQVAPAANMFEEGKVLVKLKPQAAISALTEVGEGTGDATLDQTLQNAGVISFDPVIEDVAEASGEDMLELSVQSQSTAQLYSASIPPEQDPVAVANAISQDPNVEYAEPNYIAGMVGSPIAGVQVSPQSFEPNDQYFGFQWHMKTIQMPQAWDSSRGENVIVAIIDTGVDFRAPDLANTNRLPGFDFVNNDNDPTDDQGHGTHVAGTIAQSTNNGIGVSGVAYNAKILPVKVLAANGNGSYEHIIKGITYAVNQGAKVINMSLAGRQGSQALLDTVRMAHERGVLVVVAAGNSGGPVEFPAAYDDYVLAVGATRLDNTRTGYSNFGPQIDIMAPGGDVDVDQNGDGFADGILQQTFKSAGNYTYLFFEGTSMASPHVAGVAALLYARMPNASPAQIEGIITQTALDIGTPAENGAGLIQAFAALSIVAPPTDPATPTTESPVDPATPTTESPVDPATPTTVPPTETTVPPTETIVPPTETTVPPTETTVPPTETTVPPTVLPTVTTIPPTVAPSTPTPTTQPPTAVPPPPGELLLNGGFEADEAWLFPDTPVRGTYSSDIVFSGNRAAKVGILPGETDRYSYTSVVQKVTIPAEAGKATLNAYVYPISEATYGNAQNIFILNSSFRTIRQLSQELSNSRTWEQRSYDVSDLRGQTIYVYFGVLNYGGSNQATAMYVDQVSLSWSP